MVWCWKLGKDRKMKKIRKGKKMNRARVVSAFFRQMSKQFYTIGADCLSEELTHTSITADWKYYSQYREWILNTEFNWNVWLAVFCVNPTTGEKYVKQAVCASTPAIAAEVQDKMTDALDALYDGCNPSHRVCRVWWATIWDVDFEAMQDDMIAMLEAKGAFDRDVCQAAYEKKVKRLEAA